MIHTNEGGPNDPVIWGALTLYEAVNLFLVLGICFFLTFDITLFAIWMIV